MDLHQITRRKLLHQMGCGFGAVALQSILQQDSLASPRIEIDPINPVWPRTPTVAPRAKNVIFLFMVGGPGSMDTFDYKPTLQRMGGQPLPETLRQSLTDPRFANVLHKTEDELLASPWKFRRYGESGWHVSELFQHTARHVDDLCFVHSLQADSNNHGPASIQFHTGNINGGKASLGSWVTYGLGTLNQDLPAYVLLFDVGPLGGSTNYSNAFLPPAFQGTRLLAAQPPVLDLLPPEQYADTQRESLDVLLEINRQHRATRPGYADLDARIASYELAYRMQTSAMDVADLTTESKSTLTAYGIGSKNEREDKYARKCLLARRLVERGVRFVQLYDMSDADGWDAHDDLKGNHEACAAACDRPVAALLDDLKQHGLWDDTLVIFASEFGRTPTVQGKRKPGRQHNCAGFTIWMAGGGTKPGLHYGATDEFGLQAVDRPMHFRDLHATILHALGLDHQQLTYEVSGRMERLTGVENQASVVRELLV